MGSHVAMGSCRRVIPPKTKVEALRISVFLSRHVIFFVRKFFFNLFCKWRYRDCVMVLMKNIMERQRSTCRCDPE